LARKPQRAWNWQRFFASSASNSVGPSGFAPPAPPVPLELLPLPLVAAALVDAAVGGDSDELHANTKTHDNAESPGSERTGGSFRAEAGIDNPSTRRRIEVVRLFHERTRSGEPPGGPKPIERVAHGRLDRARRIAELARRALVTYVAVIAERGERRW